MPSEEDLIAALDERFPCRLLQIRQLIALYSPSVPNPSTLIVHGLEATGKTSIVKAVLESHGLPHAFIQSRECITGRHLLERTVATALDAVDADAPEPLDRRPYQKCESLSTLAVHLQRLLENRDRPLVLVFDGIDRQREAPPTLLPALARLGETVPNLHLIFIITIPKPRMLHTTGVLHVDFPNYTKDAAIRIVSRNPPPIFPPTPSSSPDEASDSGAEDDAWVWSRFLAVLWDSQARAAASSLTAFRRLAHRLWRPFVQPIVDGTFGTRDFSRLLLNRRFLFQTESALLDRSSVVGSLPSTTTTSTTPQPATPQTLTHHLPYYPKLLLIAAYLCSFNPARQDSLYFLKAHEKKRKRRAAGGGQGRPPKHRKIPRHLLSPGPFPLDRLLSVFRAILPGGGPPPPQTADLMTAVATLAALRLILRTGTVGAGAGAFLDPLDASGVRWRVNVGWEVVSVLGRSVGVEVGEWLVGGE